MVSVKTGLPYKCIQVAVVHLNVISVYGHKPFINPDSTVLFSPERIIREMKEVITRYGAHEIYFDDDTFTGNKKHVLSICSGIHKERLKIPWSVMGDAMCTDEEMLYAMKRPDVSG
jgi:hypothetical protein